MKIVETKRNEKPRFIRQDTNKTKRLKKVWRKPKGLHSKIRLNKRGHAKKPSLGYGSPKSIRGGKKFKLVHNLNELEDAKSVVISSSVGLKKKVEILKIAQEKKLEILNVKQIDKFLKDVEEKLKQKKEKKKKVVEKKEKKKKELEKKEAKGEEVKSEEEEKKDISKKLAENVKQKPTEIVDTKPSKSQDVHRATAPKQK
tara:strand:- start:1222 stop:1821 length:600 start_codon:yes stop_codon:yes gene_type:complete